METGGCGVRACLLPSSCQDGVRALGVLVSRVTWDHACRSLSHAVAVWPWVLPSLPGGMELLIRGCTRPLCLCPPLLRGVLRGPMALPRTDSRTRGPCQAGEPGLKWLLADRTGPALGGGPLGGRQVLLALGSRTPPCLQHQHHYLVLPAALHLRAGPGERLVREPGPVSALERAQAAGPLHGRGGRGGAGRGRGLAARCRGPCRRQVPCHPVCGRAPASVSRPAVSHIASLTFLHFYRSQASDSRPSHKLHGLSSRQGTWVQPVTVRGQNAGLPLVWKYTSHGPSSSPHIPLTLHLPAPGPCEEHLGGGHRLGRGSRLLPGLGVTGPQ